MPTPNQNLVSIVHLPRSLAASTGMPVPTGRKVYQQVIDGLIPAEYVRGAGTSTQASCPRSPTRSALPPLPPRPIAPPHKSNPRARQAAGARNAIGRLTV